MVVTAEHVQSLCREVVDTDDLLVVGLIRGVVRRVVIVVQRQGRIVGDIDLRIGCNGVAVKDVQQGQTLAVEGTGRNHVPYKAGGAAGCRRAGAGGGRVADVKK